MRLHFRADVDPKDFAVNINHNVNTFTPAVVREAMEQLQSIALNEMNEQNPGWKQSKLDGYIVDLDFYMIDNRNDVDGPSKRVLDAISRGAGFNDNRVQELRIRKFVSTRPWIDVMVTQCLPWDYDLRDYKKPKRRPIPPWDEDDERRDADAGWSRGDSQEVGQQGDEPGGSHAGSRQLGY